MVYFSAFLFKVNRFVRIIVLKFYLWRDFEIFEEGFIIFFLNDLILCNNKLTLNYDENLYLVDRKREIYMFYKVILF